MLADAVLPSPFSLPSVSRTTAITWYFCSSVNSRQEHGQTLSPPPSPASPCHSDALDLVVEQLLCRKTKNKNQIGFVLLLDAPSEMLNRDVGVNELG